ncbi:hypothetical protein CA212_114 [Candidatus Nasuia deltocephalinicola]|nr:hypothetical protein CA212_114 [Candidatus Nasuia deltocephalinicola]
MIKKIIYIIIIVHGSKKKKWLFFCKKIKNFLKKNIFKINKIYISFISKKKPYLIKIINNGINKLIFNYFIIPLFLSDGKHTKNDLKKIIKNILNIYNNIFLFKTYCINKEKNIINLLKINYLKKIKKCIKYLNNIYI